MNLFVHVRKLSCLQADYWLISQCRTSVISAGHTSIWWFIILFYAPLSLKSIFVITIELQVVQLLFCKESYCANYICSDILESRDSSVRWAGRFCLSQQQTQQQQQHALWVDCKMVWALSLWGQEPKVPSLYSLCGLSGRMDVSLLHLIVQVEDPAPTEDYSVEAKVHLLDSRRFR